MRKRVLLGGLGLFFICALPAIASKNDGGAMIVHTNDGYSYSSQSVCTATEGDPGSCGAAVTTASKDAGQVIWFLAAFDPAANPGVSVVYFGLNYDSTNLLIDRTKACAPAGTTITEVPDDNWPAEGGISIAYDPPISADLLFPFYVFEVSGGVPNVSFFGSGINPTGGYAAFVDDLQPPGEDRVDRFGMARWGEAGDNACPVPPRSGACCIGLTATCETFISDADCVNAGGIWLGTGSSCSTVQCGACCFWRDQGNGYYSRNCVVTSLTDCEEGANYNLQIDYDPAWDAPDSTHYVTGPEWSGPGHACAIDAQQADSIWFCADPRTNDTPPYNAVRPTTWGMLKSLFR